MLYSKRTKEPSENAKRIFFLASSKCYCSMYLSCKISSESFASKVESGHLVILLVTIINNRNIIVPGCELSSSYVLYRQIKEQALRNTKTNASTLRC